MVFFASCKKIEKLTNFYIDINEEFNVNPSLAQNNILDTWMFIAYNSKVEYLGEYNTTVAGIEKIAFSKFDLSIVSPNDQNFDFIESIEVFMTVTDKDPLRVAWLDRLPESGMNDLELSFVVDNIKDYLIEKDNLLNIRITTTSNENIDLKLKLHYRFYLSSELNE